MIIQLIFQRFDQNVNCLKDKSCSDPPQIDLTDMDDSNSWLVDGGGSHPRSGGLHHCGGETITEGSWTTPAEPAWIPEEIASREDGKTFYHNQSIWKCNLVHWGLDFSTRGVSRLGIRMVQINFVNHEGGPGGGVAGIQVYMIIWIILCCCTSITSFYD